MAREIKFGNRMMGDGHPAYVIAEIGINHNGDLDVAKKIIDGAVHAGADAVKFQKRTPEVSTPLEQQKVMRETPWGYITYLDYRYKVEFNEEQYREIDRYCKEKGIRLSGPALGRPKKNQVINKKQEYIDICDRVEVERDFSLAKSKCGLGLITTRLKETTEHVVALSILVLNLRKVLCAFVDFLLSWIYFCIPRRKLAFIQ